MAVTITVAALASALRVGDSTEETAQVTRLLEYATTTIAAAPGRRIRASRPRRSSTRPSCGSPGYLFDATYCRRAARPLPMRSAIPARGACSCPTLFTGPAQWAGSSSNAGALTAGSSFVARYSIGTASGKPVETTTDFPTWATRIDASFVDAAEARRATRAVRRGPTSSAGSARLPRRLRSALVS